MHASAIASLQFVLWKNYQNSAKLLSAVILVKTEISIKSESKVTIQIVVCSRKIPYLKIGGCVQVQPSSMLSIREF